MDSIKIYSSDGALLIDAVLEDSSAQDWGIMSENQVSLDFYTDECIILPASCYIDYEGQRFWLLDEYKPTENNSAEWSYQVRFLGAESLLAVTVVLNQTDGSDEPIFNLTAPASQHLEFIVSNLNRRFPGMGWSVGSVPSTENIFIEYAGTYASDALQTIVGDKYEWWVDDFVVNIGRCEFGERIELGYQNGLLGGITYSTANEMRSYAYLYPIGSTRNIDPSKYGYSRLQLPDGLTRIDINPEQGLAELVESDAFADIFPRYVGKVTAVRTSSGKNEDGTSFTIYHIKDSLIPFNPNNYEIAGEVKQITFQSGELMGAEFEVNYDADNKEFEIITQFQNGGLSQLPGGALIPKVGDKYVVWNISMPDEYYPLAEQEFLQAALAFASESVKEASVYRAPVDFIEVQQRGLRLRPGQRVRLLSDEYFPDKGYYNSRITRITREICYPDEITIEVCSVLNRGTISRIRNEIEDSSKRIERAEKSIPMLVTSDSVVEPTDFSVYSSLASEKRFLSKKKGGTVEADTTFKKNVSVGGNITSEDFVNEGMLGRGFGVTKDANGNTVVTTDILQVRKSAEFYELIINQMSFSRGATVHSAAGCEITSVEVVGDSYRCYYDNKGGKRYSGFVVGDQARCQRFDAEYNGIVKYYWRVVVATGENYVDLAIAGSDANGYPLTDGVGVPGEGDELVQMGNRTDKTRQGVIVIASTPTPTILQYDGINSFVLPAPSTKVAPNDNEFSGRFHINAGSTGASNLADLPEVVKEAVGDIEVGTLSVGRNLLRNSGFTGDYRPTEVKAADVLTAMKEVYSDSLKYWEAQNATVQPSELSQSGIEVVVSNGTLTQSLKDEIIVGETYIFSFYAKGESLNFAIGGITQTRSLSDAYERYSLKFRAVANKPVLQIRSANATICMPQLERGNVLTEWGLSVYDNDKSLAYFQALQYLSSAIKDGSVDILGGLILANMLLLGNYQDGEMKEVTAGVSGVYNDNDDVAFWAGGEMKKAITTVRRFRENSRYQPSDAEWADMANFVATHGGDLFLRGYIFALGGFFRGTVSIANGKIQLDEDGSGRLSNGSLEWDKEGRLYKNFPDTVNWRSLHDYEIDYSKGGYYIAESHNEQSFTLPAPPITPYRIVLKAADVVLSDNKDVTFVTEGNFWYTKPDQSDMADAKVVVGKRLVITTKNNASKGNIELTSNAGELWELFIPLTMVVGGEDDVECDVKIY